MSIKQQGVTFIEVMITIAIVAIVASQAVPQYFSYIEDNRLRHAAEDLYSKLYWARSESIKNNTQVDVVTTTGSGWCVGFSSSGGCNCNTAGNCNMGALVAADYPQTTLSKTWSGSGAAFEPNQGMIDTAGTVTLSAGARSVNVEINKMGFSKICSANTPGYKSC
jgi:type IV fimbrial biogenesis protein FimT